MPSPFPSLFAGLFCLIAMITTATAADSDSFSSGADITSSTSGTVGDSYTAHTLCEPLPRSSPLGLLDAIETGLCRNPKSRQTWANLKAQADQVGLAKAAYWPTLDVKLGNNQTRSHNEVKGAPDLNTKTNINTRIDSMNLNLVLFDFGLRHSNLDTAQKMMHATYAHQDATLQAIFLDIAQAFHAAQANQAALSASVEAERLAKESYLAIDARYQAGTGSLSDKLQGQTALSQATLNRVKAEGELESALGTFAVAMGLPPNAALTLETPDDRLPNIDFVSTIEMLIEEACRNHPALLAAQAELDAAKAKIDAVRAEGRPSIILTASTVRTDQLGQSPAETFSRSGTIGVQINVPVFQGFGQAYRIHNAEAQAEAKADELENQSQQIALEVWKDYQSLRTATESLKATASLIDSAKTSFNVTRGRYKAGVGNIIELLNAQSALASAEQQRIQSLLNWRTTRLQLAASLGRLGLWAIH